MSREWDRPFPSPREAAEQIAAIRKETKMAEVKIDVAKLNENFRAAMAKNGEKANRVEHKQMGLAGIDPAQLGEDICSAWAAVQPQLPWLKKFAGWIPGLVTVISIVEAFMPVVCSIAAPKQ